MLKKLLFFGLLFFFAFLPARAASETDLYFVYSTTCPHCHQESDFLDSLQKRYPDLTIHRFDVQQPQTKSQVQEFANRFNIRIQTVPFTVIADQYFFGFNQSTGQQIEKIIQNNHSVSDSSSPSVRLPILGQINLKSLSLPLLTFVVALLDGFNPCAMWTLLFLISLLLGMKNRKRMWILGSAFIITSGLVYFLFLSAWLNLFLFLGFITIVRLIIGLVALASGSYYLRDYWINKDGACKVSDNKKRQKVFNRLKLITQKDQFLAALLGIILLAIAVNLVELVCSAGLPAIYTQILSLADLPPIQYYIYLLFYILIFMLDDLVVFFIAMTSLKAVGLDSKYARYSHLIGGILMLIIGILVIFRPQALTFG